MPFFYDLKLPELEGSIPLSGAARPRTRVHQANTEIALLRSADQKVILRIAGRGVLSAWYVPEGAPVQPGQVLARIDADGEDITLWATLFGSLETTNPDQPPSLIRHPCNNPICSSWPQPLPAAANSLPKPASHSRSTRPHPRRPLPQRRPHSLRNPPRPRKSPSRLQSIDPRDPGCPRSRFWDLGNHEL